MVTHFFEGQPRLDQMPSTCVTQTVRTAAFPCPVSICCRQTRGHDVREAAGGERPEGRAHRQEQCRVIALRPRVADIAAEGMLDTGFERKNLSLPALGTGDLDAVQ